MFICQTTVPNSEKLGPCGETYGWSNLFRQHAGRKVCAALSYFCKKCTYSSVLLNRNRQASWAHLWGALSAECDYLWFKFLLTSSISFHISYSRYILFPQTHTHTRASHFKSNEVKLGCGCPPQDSL